MKMTLEQAIEQKRDYLQKLFEKQESARLDMIEVQASVGMAVITSALTPLEELDDETDEKLDAVIEAGIEAWLDSERLYTRLQRGIDYQTEELKILEKKMEVSK
jgi:flagellar biosynthesis chaperone FliJ